MTNTQSTKNKINKDLRLFVNARYHEAIPLDAIFGIVRTHAGQVVDIDGTPWSGLLCGEEGSSTFDIAGVKFHLIVSWYKMPSGRYEINSYVT